MNRVKLPDGFIDFAESGNTYAGKCANDIMIASWRIKRDTEKALGCIYDLDKCIKALIKELENQGKIVTQ